MDRRTFLGALGAAVGFTAVRPGGRRTGLAPADRSAAGRAARAPSDAAGRPRMLGRIGIQLYTVRAAMDHDVEGTLAALARIGYREVELAGLHGKTAKEMRAILDRHGLAVPSSHIALETIRGDWPRTLDDAMTLGQRYIVCPDVDERDRTMDGYRRVAAELNAAGEAARRAGLALAYHNHDYELVPVNGTRPYDLLLAACDPGLVRMEMDLFWLVKGGGDPLAYLVRYPGRFPMVHVKDMTHGGAMVDVGRGAIDFRAIFAGARPGEIEHYFVEHDDPPSPLVDARVSYDYLRRLRF